MSEFVFDLTDWELALEKRKPGDTVGAGYLLSLLSGEEEAREALTLLEEKKITLTLSDLPKYTGTGQGADRLAMEAQLVKQQDWIASLEENDPLAFYLQELAQIPAAGDPDMLASQLEKGNREVMSRLADLMLSLVVEEAKSFTGYGVLLMDLIQEGSLGLWQGLGCYAGGGITEHCLWWIRQSMAGAVLLQASAGGVGQKLRKALEDFRDTDERLLVELGRNPTLEEVAQHLHITPEEAYQLEEQYSAARSMARAAPREEPQRDEQEETQAVENTAYFAMRQRIQELLSQLTDQDAQLLTLRYGLDGQPPMKPQQVALRLKLTAEEVVKREGQALALLRNRGS